MSNSPIAEAPFFPADQVPSRESTFTNTPARPAADRPTLQKLRNASPDERQAALRELFLFDQPSIRSYIHHKWPQLQPPAVEDLASEFVIFCLTGGRPQLLTCQQRGTGPPCPQGAVITSVSEIDEKLRHLARLFSLADQD